MLPNISIGPSGITAMTPYGLSSPTIPVSYPGASVFKPPGMGAGNNQNANTPLAPKEA